MTKEFTPPSDTIEVAEYKVFMSYARLLRITSLFPQGLADLARANEDVTLFEVMVELLLAEDGVEPDKCPKLHTYKLSITDGETLVEWGLAHAFGFFARKVNSTLNQAELAAKTIKDVEEAAKALTPKTN